MTTRPNPFAPINDRSQPLPHEAASTARRKPTALVAFGTAATVAFGVWSASPPVQAADKFEEAEVFLELNHTDGDLGIHAKVDGDAWKKMEIKDPNGVEILEVRGKGKLGRHGLTEIFFESEEPNFKKLPPADFLKKFPEGKYKVIGTTIDGERLKSTTRLTHVMPAPPGDITINGIPAAKDCDAKPLPKVKKPVTIRWAPVTQSHPTIGVPGVIEVNNYQLVVELEEPQLLVFSVDLPPSKTKMRISKQFLEPGTEYKMEVLVREKSYNQTAVETCFKVVK
jgi:hypothetical protein